MGTGDADLMAALDFPNSPTLNQQYAAPNGVTYQWDGAAWIVTGGPANLWTASGSALMPTDATKTIVVGSGVASLPSDMIQWGKSTARIRLTEQAAGASQW